MGSLYLDWLDDAVEVAADATGYCVWAVAGGRNWYLAGPDGDPTTTACA